MWICSAYHGLGTADPVCGDCVWAESVICCLLPPLWVPKQAKPTWHCFFCVPPPAIVLLAKFVLRTLSLMQKKPQIINYLHILFPREFVAINDVTSEIFFYTKVQVVRFVKACKRCSYLRYVGSTVCTTMYTHRISLTLASQTWSIRLSRSLNLIKRRASGRECTVQYSRPLGKIGSFRGKMFAKLRIFLGL